MLRRNRERKENMAKGTSPPAPFGLLDSAAFRTAVLLEEFFLTRDQALQRGLGRVLKRSPVREQLIRTIILQYAVGLSRHLSFYQEQLADLSGRSSVAAEARLLVDAGLVVLRTDPADKRAQSVLPTVRMIAWYNEETARIREESKRLWAV